MRNRRRMFSKQFGFGRGMGRGFGHGRGLMNGTGPRAQMGICPRYSQSNLAEYKQFLEEELKTVKKELKSK